MELIRISMFVVHKSLAVLPIEYLYLKLRVLYISESQMLPHIKITNNGL